MKKQFYGIYDRIAEKYTFVFESENGKTATRLFQNEQMRDGSILKESPEDFKLWHLSEFDDETGEFKNNLFKLADGKPKE